MLAHTSFARPDELRPLQRAMTHPAVGTKFVRYLREFAGFDHKAMIWTCR
jgi:hypothetical protein